MLVFGFSAVAIGPGSLVSRSALGLLLAPVVGLLYRHKNFMEKTLLLQNCASISWHHVVHF